MYNDCADILFQPHLDFFICVYNKTWISTGCDVSIHVLNVAHTLVLTAGKLSFGLLLFMVLGKHNNTHTNKKLI